MGNTVSRIHPIATNSAGWSALWVAAWAAFRSIKSLNLHDPESAALSASRITSLVHSALSAYWSAPLIYGKTVKQIRLRAEHDNTERENKIIDFSLAYFLVDLVYLLVFERDPLFLAHHIMVLVLFSSTRFANKGRGLGSVAHLTAVAYSEPPSVLLNLWWLARRAGQTRLANGLLVPFTALFLLARVFVLPYIVLPVSCEMMAGTFFNRLPLWLRRLWGASLFLAVLGGWVWAKGLVANFMQTFFP